MATFKFKRGNGGGNAAVATNEARMWIASVLAIAIILALEVHP